MLSLNFIGQKLVGQSAQQLSESVDRETPNHELWSLLHGITDPGGQSC